MKRFASIRFDRVLAPARRQAAVRTLSSAGVEVTSWSDSAARTYAGVLFDRQPEAVSAAALLAAQLDVPPLVVLRVTPDSAAPLAALGAALGGAGAPVAVVDVCREAGSVVLEIRPPAPLGLIVALVDAELGPARPRRIEPLLPLDDATLTAFAAHLLGEPGLDPSRLIETHLEPLLARAGTGA